jgi:hypothetical protein
MSVIAERNWRLLLRLSDCGWDGKEDCYRKQAGKLYCTSDAFPADMRIHRAPPFLLGTRYLLKAHS